MAIQSNRNKPCSFHTTPDVMRALQTECGSLEIHRSQLIHQILVKEMRRRGYHYVHGLEYSGE